MNALIVEAPGNPLGFEFAAEVDRRMDHYFTQTAGKKDPGWCTGTCGAPNCNKPCAGAKGHNNPHRCWEHMP